MGRIPDEDVQRVREATDVVEVVSESVVLKKKGRLFWGLCPFHSEKTPSFKVDPVTQLWHCFGCGEGGDVFGFVMRVDGLEFPDAVRRLAERARIEIREEGSALPAGHKQRLAAACEAAAVFYHRQLIASKERGASQARAYLADRGFGIDVAKRFSLGYAAGGKETLSRALVGQGFQRDEIVDANLAVVTEGGALKDRFFNRIIFPIGDVSGRIVGFGGRVIGDGHPKYLNTQETAIFHKSSNLYGIHLARNEIVSSGTAVVVEGYTDVIALHEAGMAYVVATLGTALTEKHVRLLGRFAKRVVYLFDGDEAGLKAANRAAEFVDWQATPEAGSSKIDLAVAVIPDGLDPADFVTTAGADAMAALVGDAVPLVRFVIDQRLSAEDLATPEGRTAGLASAARVLVPIKDSLLAQDYMNYLGERLLVDYQTVQRVVLAAKPESPRTASERTTDGVGPSSTSAQARMERELLRCAVVSPSLRGRAQDLLREALVVDVQIAAALDAVASAGEATGRALYEAVAAVDRDAADSISQWVMDAANVEQVEYGFREIALRLKEFALERQILLKRAEMNGVDAASERERYDTLVREIASLQRARDELRRAAATSIDGDQES